MRRILTISQVGSRRAVAVGAVVVLAAGAAACESDDEDHAVASADPIDVVVTTSILGDIVTSALGDLVGTAVEVEVVLPLGADPHDFEPSARQAETMEDADLLVVNGLGLEEGLGGVIDAVAESGTPVFTFTDHIELIEFESEHGDEEHADEEHGDDEHGDEEHADDEHGDEEHADDEHGDEEHADDEHGHDGEDPHFWMDPLRVTAALDALAAELVELGVDAELLDASIDRYAGVLEDLSEQIDETLADVPAERRALVTNHDAFGYFADRFDFEVLGTVIPSLTTNAESSARSLEELAALVAERRLPAVFAETTESDRLAQALADEVGSDVAVVELYSGSLGEPGSGAETYRDYMVTNTERIAAALG